MLNHRAGALNDIKVLDLTQDRGQFAAKMLADMGADVIQVEKPEGSEARRQGPFKNDIPGIENSLYYLNFNTNKRGITLNLDAPAGQDIFKRLVKRSDVVIEDFQPGRLLSLRLDYPALRELDKRIIVASISGFGQTGPYSSYRAPDIVSLAMGGLMYVNGPADAAPVVAPCEQAYHSTSVAAVFGITAALLLRLRTGEGQLIDASGHEVIASLAGGVMQYSNSSQISQRSGSQFGSVPGRIYPCQDGYVHILTIRPNHWEGFLEVMGNPEYLAGKEWLASAYRNKNADLIDAYVVEYTMQHTKIEIAELCQDKGVPCSPVNTAEDFHRDPHIQARGFFVEMEHPAIGKHLYPGPPVRMSRTPWHIDRPAPLLGQHNHEVFCDELGYTDGELAKFKSEGIV
jgi:CoA:oxalate CoA-transferase